MSEVRTKTDESSNDRLVPRSVGRSMLLSVVGLSLILLVGMEIKARQDNYPVTFPFNSDMWVGQWFRLDDLSDDHTVIVGASRVRHGIIIDEWDKQTGTRPLSLAWPGSPPVPVLEELADRESFNGLVVCGVAPLVVFANDGPPWMDWIKQNIEQSKTRQWSLSFHLSHSAHHYLRPRIQSFNSQAYSPVSNLYFGFPIPNREGLLNPLMFRFIGTTDNELQDRYLKSFESDGALKQQIREQLKQFNLRQLHFGFADFEQCIAQYHTAVKKIESRGGEVVFVRLPSDGWIAEFENTYYPREQCYDRLIEVTGCLGIHFQDYDSLKNLHCVEESHLSVSDGMTATQSIIEILRENGVLE